MEITAPGAYTVRITADHIHRGELRSGLRCPVGLAIREQCSGSTSVHVDIGCMEVWFPDSHFRAKTPSAVARFSEDFDHGQPVKPFAFDVKWGAVEDA